ncbi:hypothetical protein CK203_043422 [Vitis vinifera]|uniref:Retroviral polymerase SH3-like domain-containing protein n=1 Tax=Vitis vinifera TaxID=29760 RepID=A0A438IAL3_VITVI|nr:hypothetical protein CK203_043422 [Vitis vinifera]
MGSFLLILISEFLGVWPMLLMCTSPINLLLEPNDVFFLGYPVGQKAYKLYDLDTHQMFTSRDVVFHETIFPYESIPSPSSNSDPVIPLSISDLSPPVHNPHHQNLFLPSNTLTTEFSFYSAITY